jgi:hypothetical protein
VTIAPGVFTTAGDIALSEENKEELSSNLRSQRLNSQIEKAAKGLFMARVAFMQEMIRPICPKSAYDSFMGHSDDQFGAYVEWAKNAGISFKWDGLKMVFLRRGSVLAESVFPVSNPLFESLIESKVKEIEHSENKKPLQ